MKEKEIIFISSRQKELHQIRAALKVFLEENVVFKKVFKIILFEDDLSGRRESPKELYIEWIKKSDVYIGIFDREHSEPIQEEYLQAVKDKIVKKEIIVCVHERWGFLRSRKLKRFLKEAMDRCLGHSIIEFEAIGDLKSKLEGALLRYWHRKHEGFSVGSAHMGFPKEFPKNSNIPENFRRRLWRPLGRRIRVNRALGVVESFVYNEDGDLIDVTKDYLGADAPQHVLAHYTAIYKKPVKGDQR